MIEKVKGIYNPLTIIAIFAALAEIAGTIALATVKEDLQFIFLWFVMLFPTLLVLLFYATLNFNPKVLYAPSDFRDDTHFLHTLSGSYKTSNTQIQITKDNLDEANRDIVDNRRPVIPMSSSQLGDKGPLEVSNQFMSAFLPKVRPLIKNDTLKYIAFQFHTQEFYLLSIAINDKLLPPRRIAEFAFIIRITKSPAGEYQLEVIGHDVQATNPKRFAEQLHRTISSIIKVQLSDKPEYLKEQSS